METATLHYRKTFQTGMLAGISVPVSFKVPAAEAEARAAALRAKREGRDVWSGATFTIENVEVRS